MNLLLDGEAKFLLNTSVQSGCSAVGSVRALGAWGRRFESSHPDHRPDQIPHPSKIYRLIPLILVLFSFEVHSQGDANEIPVI